MVLRVVWAQLAPLVSQDGRGGRGGRAIPESQARLADLDHRAIRDLEVRLLIREPQVALALLAPRVTQELAVRPQTLGQLVLLAVLAPLGALGQLA